jgi:trigger factor
LNVDVITATPTATDPCHFKLDITISAAEVNANVAARVKQYRQSAQVPGFRPGKIPVGLLKKRFMKSILADVKQTLIRESLQEAISKADLSPVTLPQFVGDDAADVVEDSDYGYKVEFDVAPEFEVPDYKGLRLTQPKLAVDDEHVERYIADLRRQRAIVKKTERPAAAEDLVKVGYRADVPAGHVPDSAKGILKAEETWLALEESTVIPGIREHLSGLSAGDTKRIAIEFPVDYVESFLAGKTVEYEFDIREVNAIILPDFDNAFAKSIGVDSVEELRETVRATMRQHLEAAQKMALREQVYGQLVAGPDFDLPPNVLKAETSRTLYDLVARNHASGGSQEEFAATVENHLEAAAKDARNRLKLRYVVDAIASNENIEATHEEIHESANSIREQMTKSARGRSPDIDEDALQTMAANAVVSNKVLARVVELNDIVEGDPETNDSDGGLLME